MTKRACHYLTLAVIPQALSRGLRDHERLMRFQARNRALRAYQGQYQAQESDLRRREA